MQAYMRHTYVTYMPVLPVMHGDWIKNQADMIDPGAVHQILNVTHIEQMYTLSYMYKAA